MIHLFFSIHCQAERKHLLSYLLLILFLFYVKFRFDGFTNKSVKCKLTQFFRVIYWLHQLSLTWICQYKFFEILFCSPEHAFKFQLRLGKNNNQTFLWILNSYLSVWSQRCTLCFWSNVKFSLRWTFGHSADLIYVILDWVLI